MIIAAVVPLMAFLSRPRLVQQMAFLSACALTHHGSQLACMQCLQQAKWGGWVQDMQKIVDTDLLQQLHHVSRRLHSILVASRDPCSAAHGLEQASTCSSIDTSNSHNDSNCISATGDGL